MCNTCSSMTIEGDLELMSPLSLRSITHSTHGKRASVSANKTTGFSEYSCNHVPTMDFHKKEGQSLEESLLKIISKKILQWIPDERCPCDSSCTFACLARSYVGTGMSGSWVSTGISVPESCAHNATLLQNVATAHGCVLRHSTSA